jgi:hypothetical protein
MNKLKIFIGRCCRLIPGMRSDWTVGDHFETTDGDTGFYILKN